VENEQDLGVESNEIQEVQQRDIIIRALMVDFLEAFTRRRLPSRL
jgi:hypothetical protein